MATNHTTNYALNLWEPTDAFVREEFNENTSKIDAAIKAVDAKADTKADASSLNSLSSIISTKARILVGTFTGNGAASRTIRIGATPRAVLVTNYIGVAYSPLGYHGGLALDTSPSTVGGQTIVSIVSGGFTVAYNGQSICSNEANEVYHYIAIV